MAEETNPDSPDYLGLPLYDADEQDLVDAALANAAVDLPEWSPREGNTEVVLLEAMALQVSEVVFGLNRLASTVIEGMLRLYKLSRDPGAPSTGSVEFTLSDSVGHSIPASTTLRATVESTGELIDLVTVEPLDVLSPENTGTVIVRTVDSGSAGNGLPAGTVLELIDAVPYVDTVVTTSPLAGGRDPETDQAFYDRGATLLARLVSTLVLAEHFTLAALADPAVGRAYTLDLFDPEDSGSAPGDNPGHVSVAVTDELGDPLDPEIKDALQASLTAAAIAGLTVHIIDATVTPVDVTATITIAGTNDAASVIDAVEATIAEYLSPQTHPWDGVIYRNELISLIDQVPGVGRVVTITTPASDVTLTGHAALPTAGTISVSEA